MTNKVSKYLEVVNMNNEKVVMYEDVDNEMMFTLNIETEETFILKGNDVCMYGITDMLYCIHVKEFVYADPLCIENLRIWLVDDGQWTLLNMLDSYVRDCKIIE